jgi:hypothetical protein
MFDEPPDVTEIKTVLRQSSQNIRDANGNDVSPIENDISREKIMKEISKDFSEIITEPELSTVGIEENIIIQEKSKPAKKPSPKKSSKKKSKRKRRRKKSRR